MLVYMYILVLINIIICFVGKRLVNGTYGMFNVVQLSILVMGVYFLSALIIVITKNQIV